MTRVEEGIHDMEVSPEYTLMFVGIDTFKSKKYATIAYLVCKNSLCLAAACDTQAVNGQR